MRTPSASTACHHDHLVEFYDADGVLVDSVTQFVVPALRAGNAVVIVATTEHLAAFGAAFTAAGIDVTAAALEGRYVVAEAQALLREFMVDGSPDRRRFLATVKPLLDAASAGGREVRVYGELVALLLATGDAESTIAVEDLWNDLSSAREFELLCGYPSSALEGDGRAAFESICERHTAIVPTTSYSLLSDVREQHRLVARLRQEETALRAELDRLRREQANLIEMAYHDSITGLANRRAFDHQLDREWALAVRGETDSFVVIADLDGFKALNDTYGHAAGDEVLRQFGEALGLAARGTDIVARIGGDEFGVLLVRCDERAVRAFRERLNDVLADLIDPRHQPLGVSIGHASLRGSGSPATALDRADLAMLAVKRARRHRRGTRAVPR